MLAPNTLLQDRYLIVRLLGQGGMGAVYQATDRKFGNAVALKETFYSDLHLRKAFSHEARLLNRLRHAALPVVMDYFAIGERQFLVMQYIPGKDLEQLLAERKEQGLGVFLTAQVMRWADQLLDALEYLHSQKPPIIHRDIKPQNLKLTPRGEVILLDFGLAKGVTTRQAQGSDSIRGYTPNYASLEQIRGTGTDARSDLYSIGATLYHLLTGEMPLDAMTRIAALLMGQADPMKLISELNPEVPPVIASVIEKAMSPNPDQRFASAALMRQSLRNASQNIPPAGFHRVPTLTDDPMKSPAAVGVAVAREERQYVSIGVSPEPAAAAGNDSDPDHFIILLDEHQQQPSNEEPPEAVFAPGQSDYFNQPGSRAGSPDSLSRSRSRAAVYGILAIGLIIATIGIWMYRARDLKARLIRDVAELVKTTQANVSGPALAIPMRVEALHYFLEIAPSGDGPTRATGLMPLAGGSLFKFHFRSRLNGYLYIIALGKGGALQTFLTEQPMASSGVITNQVEAGREFQFPDGGQWFMIERDADTTPFTVIFSPTPIKVPEFLAAASGRALSQVEQKELSVLKGRFAAATADMVATADNNQPTVAVQVSAERSANEPLIFDISIKKK